MIKRWSLLSIAVVTAIVGLFVASLLVSYPTPTRAAPASASRYVYTKGEDTGECTRNFPCRTLQYALTQADPGDTLVIAGGTYTGTINVDKTVTLDGGYNVWCFIGNCTWSRVGCVPSATVLDGLRAGRVIDVGAGVAFTANCLTLSSGEADRGGGLYAVDAATVTLSNAIVSYNHASLGGGGIYVSNVPLTLHNTEVKDNDSGTDGGGVYIVNSDATLTDNDIHNNAADDDGGGCYIHSSDHVILSRNAIHNNLALSDGGGIYLEHSDDSRLAGNELYNNQTDTPVLEVGGLYIRACRDVAMTNNLLAANSGTALSVSESEVRLLHTTIARSMYGIRLRLGTAWLTNTMLVSHTTGIDAASGSTATLQATLWGAGAWANTTDWIGGGAILTGTVNIWGDPAFVDPDGGDYHIRIGSAAINAGVNAGVTEDIDGDPRPSGGGYDIGADELPLLSTYLPLVLRNYP